MGINDYKLTLHQKIGEWTVRQKVPYNAKLAVNKRKRWIMECSCGTRETVPEYYVLRSHSPKLDCGCKRKSILTYAKEEHGIWNMMHVRTEDPRHEAYKHYGGRGITVCPEWNKSSPDGLGFERFLSHVGARPSPAHSIDRINNDEGYKPGNVRWATSKEQRANQRPRKA